MRFLTYALCFIAGLACGAGGLIVLADMRAHAYVGPMLPGPRVVAVGDHTIILSPRYTAVLQGHVDLAPVPLRPATYMWTDRIVCDGYDGLRIESWPPHARRNAEKGTAFRLAGRTFARSARGAETVLTTRGAECVISLIVDHSRPGAAPDWLAKHIIALEPR